MIIGNTHDGTMIIMKLMIILIDTEVMCLQNSYFRYFIWMQSGHSRLISNKMEQLVEVNYSQ